MLKKVTRRILKTILWIILSFVALDLLIVTLIIIPPIQQFIVLKASKILTQITGGKITADKIYLSPTLTLTVKNFAIKDHRHENMIFAATLKGKINIAKTGGGQVCLSFAELDDGEVVLRQYAGEDTVNIALWAKGFKKEEKKDPKFKLLFENIQLNDVRFVFISDNKRLYKEDNTIDYAFFELQHIHLNVDDFLVLGPDISCKINALTLSQHTGFEITSFAGNFRIYPQGLLLDSLCFTTPHSLFKGDFAFRYTDFKDFSDFVNLINFDTKVKSASLAMKDIVYFAPALEGMDNQLIFSGEVGGVVNHIQTKDIYLKFKQQTYFSGDFAIANVLDFKKSSYNIFFKDANVNFAELKQFKLPEGKTIPLPQATENITFSRITGNYRGSFTKFNTDILVKTNLGNVAAKINTTPKDNALHYSGTIACHDLELGKLTMQPKYFSRVNLQTSLEGETTQYDNISSLVSSISLKLQGTITDIGVCGYSLKNVGFKGNYKNQKINIALNASDSLASFKLRGCANFAKNLATPTIDAVLANVTFKPHHFFSHFPEPIDSISAKGFEKFILKMQKTPNLVFTLDSIAIDLSGNHFDNFNGFVGIDYAKLSDGERTSRIDWLRLNAINKPHLPHQYIIHSNAINASFKTNYNFNDCMAALANAAEYYIPEMFKNASASNKHLATSNPDQFIDFDLQFYYTNNLFNLLLPRLNISTNTSANIHLGATREDDALEFSSPRITYAGLGRLNNIKLQGKSDDAQLPEVKVRCDSVAIYQKNGGALTFSDIDLAAYSNKKEVHFATSWRNPEAISINEKNHFNGILFGDTALNPSLKITDSKLYVRESSWQFAGIKNIITYCNENVVFNDCILSSKIGIISVDGELSKKLNKQCKISFDNFDLSLLNSLTSRLSMSFGGEMALIGIISGNEDHYAIEGRTFVNNFVFNQELLGDLFLDAVVMEDGDPHFTGGILSGSEYRDIDLLDFCYSDYLSLPNRIIELNGKWNTKTKDLRVHADIDTLKLGFLSPFLASFSDMVSGDASGHLDFVMNSDSLYFDGKVKIRKAHLGIEPLSTVYHIIDQEIEFNPQGIIFNQVLIKDKFNNEATLSGYVHHTKFKDFIIDLNISTDRILALNTHKKIDASFYGDGFVAGEISIQGDTRQLNFSSRNIKTLQGSSIAFPLTSASSVSSAQGIYFVSGNTMNEVAIEKTRKSSTIMNFDFIFDITRDADVKLELDPIDGILKCKTIGKLHLLYNTNSGDMDLNGILSIVSGKFHMSLKNFFPKDFTIVEGGTITFAGPLTVAQLNVSALYQKTASLSSLSPEFGRTDIEAYLGLTGNLMNPNPTFRFAFPKLTEREQLEVFAVLDTADQQNGIRQFFSFVFLNTFITPESNINSSQPLGAGIDMVTGMINSFLSGQLSNVNIGVNFINPINDPSATGGYSEYSVNAQVNLYNDRLLFKTNLGLGGYNDNINESSTNNFLGDFGIDYFINENWKIFFYYFNDQTEVSKPQQGGGISLKFSQDFNNKKDFIEGWRKPERRREKEKKSKI